MGSEMCIRDRLYHLYYYHEGVDIDATRFDNKIAITLSYYNSPYHKILCKVILFSISPTLGIQDKEVIDLPVVFNSEGFTTIYAAPSQNVLYIGVYTGITRDLILYWLDSERQYGIADIIHNSTYWGVYMGTFTEYDRMLVHVCNETIPKTERCYYKDTIEDEITVSHGPDTHISGRNFIVVNPHCVYVWNNGLSTENLNSFTGFCRPVSTDSNLYSVYSSDFLYFGKFEKIDGAWNLVQLTHKSHFQSTVNVRVQYADKNDNTLYASYINPSGSSDYILPIVSSNTKFGLFLVNRTYSSFSEINKIIFTEAQLSEDEVMLRIPLSTKVKAVVYLNFSSIPTFTEETSLNNLNETGEYFFDAVSHFVYIYVGQVSYLSNFTDLEVAGDERCHQDDVEAVDHESGEIDIYVIAHQAPLHVPSDQALEVVGGVLFHLQGHLLGKAFHAGRRDVGIEDQVFRVALDKARPLPEDVLDLAIDVPFRIHPAVDRLAGALHAVPADIEVEVLLALEIVVDRPLGDPRAAGQLGHVGLVEAPLGEQAGRLAQQPFAFVLVDLEEGFLWHEGLRRRMTDRTVTV